MMYDSDWLLALERISQILTIENSRLAAIYVGSRVSWYRRDWSTLSGLTGQKAEQKVCGVVRQVESPSDLGDQNKIDLLVYLDIPNGDMADDQSVQLEQVVEIEKLSKEQLLTHRCSAIRELSQWLG